MNKEFGEFGNYGFKFEIRSSALVIQNNYNKHQMILNGEQIEALQEAINCVRDNKSEPTTEDEIKKELHKDYE